MLVPALAMVGGAWVAARAAWLPIPLLVALLAAGTALGRKWGSALVWLAFGLLWAEVRWVSPQAVFAALATGRPVSLAGEVAGCWSPDEDGASAWLAVDRVEQGRAVRETAARVRVHLPLDRSSTHETRFPCGGRWAVRGYLRPPKLFRNARITEVGSWSVWVKSRSLASMEEEPDPLSRASGIARARLFANAASHGGAPRPGVALARALLLGDGNALPPSQREAMRRVGLAHLVAVSGLNVGMVAAVFLVALLGAPRGVRLLGTLAGVLAYALLVGPLPSLLRAVLMAAALLVALLLRRLPAAANGLAVSCVLLVLLDPSWIDDLGFQLSVAATAGLLLLSRLMASHMRAIGFFAAPLAVTLAAQLSTLPWSLAAFGRMSPIAPLANLLAVPWSGVALVVALAWAGTRLVVGAAADFLLVVLDELARPLAWLERIPAGPWVSWPQVAPWWAAWAATLALLSCVVWPRSRSWATARIAGAALLLVWVAPARPSEHATLTMLDVGQGDALLLRDGDVSLLVDGGGWRSPGFGGRVLIPALAAEGVRRLDVVAVTHPDSDHCFGAADLLAELRVGQVWTPPGMARTPCGERLHASGVPVHELVSGDAARLGRWRVRVLGPTRDETGPDNRRSLVLEAAAAGRRALLTGDLDAAGEAGLLRRWGSDALACDLLKVAHHGSASSSIPPLLRAVRPRLALISVGAGNSYGHPSPRVLASLARERIQVLRTDRDGRVHVEWGRPWRITTSWP
jgi:competence protein ComEC